MGDVTRGREIRAVYDRLHCTAVLCPTMHSGSIERFNALTSQTVGTGVHSNNGSNSLLKISQLLFMTKARKVGQY